MATICDFPALAITDRLQSMRFPPHAVDACREITQIYLQQEIDFTKKRYPNPRDTQEHMDASQDVVQMLMDEISAYGDFFADQNIPASIYTAFLLRKIAMPRTYEKTWQHPDVILGLRLRNHFEDFMCTTLPRLDTANLSDADAHQLTFIHQYTVFQGIKADIYLQRWSLGSSVARKAQDCFKYKEVMQIEWPDSSLRHAMNREFQKLVLAATGQKHAFTIIP